jgi:hypothetical protein
MRIKVREVPSPRDDRNLEELDGDALVTVLAQNGGVDASRPLLPTDLGPNGDVVLALLSRAAKLTAEECRRLEKTAAWRWGLLALMPAAGSVSIARSTALARARGDGRSDSIVVLQAAVTTMSSSHSHGRLGRVASTCVFNACLAVLARDLIDNESFEMLYGPWREVVHH